MKLSPHIPLLLSSLSLIRSMPLPVIKLSSSCGIKTISKSRRFVRVSASLVPSSVLEKAQKKRVSTPKPKTTAAKSKTVVRLKTSVKSKPTTTTKTKKTTKLKPTEKASSKDICHVYVLELQDGYVYVGKAVDVRKRLEAHTNGLGATFTRHHKPTGRLLKRIGTLAGNGDGPERDETLRQMIKHGVSKVRGWKYCRKTHTRADLKDIESNIRELLDLCRKCGRSGHFASACRFKTDRNGKKC